ETAGVERAKVKRRGAALTMGHHGEGFGEVLFTLFADPQGEGVVRTAGVEVGEDRGAADSAGTAEWRQRPPCVRAPTVDRKDAGRLVVILGIEHGLVPRDRDRPVSSPHVE